MSYKTMILDRPYGQGTEHEVVTEVELAGGAHLHRYVNEFDVEISAIYSHDDKEEFWWHYRDREEQMVRDWNDLKSKGYDSEIK